MAGEGERVQWWVMTVEATCRVSDRWIDWWIDWLIDWLVTHRFSSQNLHRPLDDDPMVGLEVAADAIVAEPQRAVQPARAEINLALQGNLFVKWIHSEFVYFLLVRPGIVLFFR